MHDVDLFQQALGLEQPWEVVEVSFDAEQRRLDLRIDFPRGAVFCCSERGTEGLKARDTEQKTWRHLDFFQHQAYLTARVPRVDCPEHGVRQVKVPWARERSGFEALVMALVNEMPVAAVAELIGESDMRVWRVLHHYVDTAVDAQDLSRLERLGIDETSSRRGQDYVSVFADLDGAALRVPRPASAEMGRPTPTRTPSPHRATAAAFLRPSWVQSAGGSMTRRTARPC